MLLAIIFQVTGAILLAKGLLFRKELDLVLKVFTLQKNINKKVTKMIEYHYSETYVSLFGISFLCLGYFLPLIGIEVTYDSMSLGTRLFFALLSIGLLVYISINEADLLGRKKAETMNEDMLMKKYYKDIDEMGYFISGLSEHD